MTDVEKTSAPTGDDAVVEAAERSLHGSPYFFLKGLRCRCAAGALTLRGRVPYGQLKQLAEAIVYRVDGVHRVINEIQVVNPSLSPGEAPRARTAG